MVDRSVKGVESFLTSGAGASWAARCWALDKLSLSQEISNILEGTLRNKIWANNFKCLAWAPRHLRHNGKYVVERSVVSGTLRACPFDGSSV